MNSSIARPSLIFLSSLFLLVTATACVQTPFPSGKSGALAPQVSPAAEVAALKERSDFWQNFQCKLRINVNGKTARFSSPAIVLVKSPNLLRFETFTPIGMTAALFVSNQSGPSLLIPSQKAVYTAKRPETLVREFLGGVNLPVDVFSRLLSGSIPPQMFKNIESRSQDGLLRLISRSPGGYFEWQVASGGLASVFIGTAQFEGRVSYDPPVRLAAESVPETIRISSKDWRMEVRVEQMLPATQFQPGVFQLPELPGVRRVELVNTK
jgi:outer membrane biogenesis lipoprotein LolB